MTSPHHSPYILADPLPPRPPTHIQSNYSTYYVADVGGIQGNDQSIYVHPNGLAVVGVAPGHAAVAAHLASQPANTPCGADSSALDPSALGPSGGQDAAAGEGPAASRDPPPAAAAPAAAAEVPAAAAGAGLRIRFENVGHAQAPGKSAKGWPPPLKPDAVLCRCARQQHLFQRGPPSRSLPGPALTLAPPVHTRRLALGEGRAEGPGGYPLSALVRGQLVEQNRALEQLAGAALQRYVPLWAPPTVWMAAEN